MNQPDDPQQLAERFDRMATPDAFPVECVTGNENFKLLAAALRLAEADDAKEHGRKLSNTKTLRALDEAHFAALAAYRAARGEK